MKPDSKPDPNELIAIQTSMVSAVKSSFGPSELDALRVVIRLTVEFRQRLEANEITNYVSESVFSGMDSFVSLVHAYGVLAGAEAHSHLQWKAASVTSLRREFRSLYSAFLAETTFEKRCRLLLDLFKLQIALAAMTYDCRRD
jgi:hypothetical protein